MANGAPILNGATQLDRRLAEANERERVQRHTHALLAATLSDPQETRRLLLSLPAVAYDDDGTCVLLIALPSGERLEVPMADVTRRRIGQQLLEGPDDQVA